MGFYPCLQLSVPASISTASQWIDTAQNTRLLAFSPFTFPKYSAGGGIRFWEPQRTNFHGQLLVSCLADQCHGDRQHNSGSEQNIASSVVGKARFSALTAMALGLLCPCDALAEACADSAGPTFDMPLLFGIALVGAAVGGALARQRRVELERLNNQLRQINIALKRQARIESYAPSLSYAPVGRSPDSETMINTRRDQLISKLKEGKKYLRLQDPEKAFEEFKEAFELAQSLGDPIEAKKAARGLGASCQRQRKFREAIKFHFMILSISEKEKEHSGDIDAYGAIADCYTELGDLETAAKYYDKYIEKLED